MCRRNENLTGRPLWNPTLRERREGREDGEGKEEEGEGKKVEKRTAVITKM